MLINQRRCRSMRKMRQRKWRYLQKKQRLWLNVLPGLVLLGSGLTAVAAEVHQDQTQPPGQTSETLGRATESNTSVNEKKITMLQKIPTKAKTAKPAVPLTAKTMMEERRMWFIAMPTTQDNAKSLASYAASRLQAFAGSGTKTLTVMEPVLDGGAPVDFATYQSGGYDAAFETFYTELKNLGIDDAAMGMWVLLPEANMPEWGQSDPGVISQCITRTAQLQKKHFPTSLATIMLNSQTYPGNDTTYSQGQFKSLVPYVRNIPKGLIDSFGYQGFPWARAANLSGPSSLNPAEYLRADLAIEAAKALGVETVWLNTGSFAKMYAQKPEATVVATLQQRRDILAGAEKQAAAVRAAGLGVAVNMFMEDKSQTREGTDWSFSGEARPVFDDFAARLKKQSIGLWRFE